jgi:dCTP deaminase
MPLSDRQITQLATDCGLISPFVPSKVTPAGNKGPSKGLSSAGYDVSVAGEWSTFRPDLCNITGTRGSLPTRLHPEDLQRPENYFVKIQTQVMELRPGQCVLAHSIEHLDMPNDIVGLVFCKSSWARWFLWSPPTVLEPGWSGQITFEFVNLSPVILPLQAGNGMLQVIFFKLDEAPDFDYGNGKYQNQRGVTLPR